MVTRSVMIVMCLLCLPLLLGLMEIHIGEGNTVVTGGVVGMDCLKGDGVLRTEKRTVDRFRDIVADGAFDVHILCGDTVALEVTTDSNLIEVIETKVEGEQLNITAKKSFCTNNGVTVKISTPELRLLQAGGSTDVTFSCPDIVLSQVEFQLRGTANLQAEGSAKQLRVTLHDSTELEGTGLKAETVEIEANDSSDATIFVTHKLSGTSRDTSSVTYYGSPQSVNVLVQDVSDFDPAD